jgi:transposase
VIALHGDVKILIATKPIDFRKGVHGLVLLVEETLKSSPYDGTIFVFRSKRNDRLKLLTYDGTGVILATKWLEAGRFVWPPIEDGAMRLSAAKMAPLLEGLDWSGVAQAVVKRPTKAGLSTVFTGKMGGSEVAFFMAPRTEYRSRDPDILVGIILDRDAEIERLQTSLKTLGDLLRGARSKKAGTVLETQGALDLGDLETNALPMAASEDAPSPPSERKHPNKAMRNIGFLPKHLPRVTEVIEPNSTDCPCCSGKLHRIGEDKFEALDGVPATVRTVRPKYACRACGGAVVQAPARARLFEGGMATTAFIANVIVWKFAWFIPLHRQVQMLAGHGVNIDRGTLALWVKRVAWWLTVLYELQRREIHSHPRIFCDETGMPVLEKGRKTVRIHQFWAHAVDDRPWNGPAWPAVVYIFAKSRSGREIRSHLAGYSGVVQVDAYSAYTALAKPGRNAGPITLAYCVAHARRKYTDVYKKAPSGLGRDIIDRFAKIYAVEAEIRGTSAANRRAVRQAKTAPMMSELKLVLKNALQPISAKSAMAGAIRYSLTHWAGLTAFLEDGRIEIDSNTVERTMRPIGLGRRSSLFAGSYGGAESWAILASLLQTARLNGLDPYTWLNDVLERMISGEVKSHQLDQLLAWNGKAAKTLVAETVALAA